MFSYILLLLACIVTLGVAPHPRPHSFYCSAGPLPEDPARCFDLVDQVMRESWTRDKLYFSEGSDGDARLPITRDMYGCQMGIFAYDEHSGAEFTLELYLPQLREMISVCLFQKRKIAWRRIWGVGSGIRIVIAGPGPWAGNRLGAGGPALQLSADLLNSTIHDFQS